MPEPNRRNFARMLEEVEEEEEAEALLSPRTALVGKHARRTPFVAVVVALAIGLLLIGGCVAMRSAEGRLVVRNTFGDEVTELRDKACSEYPYLKFEMSHPVLHDNLGRTGPGSGPEGIVYDTIDLGEGAGTELGHQVLMVVNATTGYTPFSSKRNGMQGKYGSINLKSGTSVGLRFTFFDRRSGDPYTLVEAAFTFFDLDTGRDGVSVESVTIHKNYKHYHLTENTEVQVTDLGDRTRFSGSTFGTGEDNPLDPMRLTHQQKNRAVTLTFENLSELKVTLAATPGLEPRFFTFVSRPSLMCAVTVQEGYVPPLDDLIAEPPLQQSVQSDYDIKEMFGALLVSPGQVVKQGDPVFTAKQPDGSLKTYYTPIDGTVIAVHDDLKSGEDLHMRLDNKTIVVVERPQFDSLVTVFPAVAPGGPAWVAYTGEGGDKSPFSAGPGLAPDLANLDGYWCGPDCVGRLGNDGEGAVPQVSKDATFVEYLKKPGDPVTPGEPTMLVKDGGRLVAVTSPTLGVVRSVNEGVKTGDKLPPPGPLALMDIRPEVSGDAKFVKYLKEVGDPVAKGDPLMVVKNIQGEEITIMAKTVGVVKSRQEDIKPGDPIAMAKDHNLMTIGPIPALPTGAAGMKAGLTPKTGQELVEFKVKPGDIIEKGEPVATLRDPATGEETPVLASHGGLVTGINDLLKPGDPVDRSEDGNLVTTGKFPPLSVEPPTQWPTNADPPDAGPGTEFVKYTVKPGDFVKEGDPIAVVKRADGLEEVVKADRPGRVKSIQEHLRPGMDLDDVMEDKNLATIEQFDKLPPLSVDPPDQWPTNNDEDNGPHCKFLNYHVKPGDRVHTGDPVATVEKADGTVQDILADRPGIVVATVPGLKPGMDLDENMVDDNLATIEKLPPLKVLPGEEGCCTPGERDCPSGRPKKELLPAGEAEVSPVGPGEVYPAGQGGQGTGPGEAAWGDEAPIGGQTPLGGQMPLGGQSAPSGLDDEGPWTFKEWKREVDDPVNKGDPIAVVVNAQTGTQREILASKNGNIVRRQEALAEGDVVPEVMKDTDLAVIGKFNPLNIGLTEKGVSAPMDAIFVKWYHLVGEEVKSTDKIAQVRLGVQLPNGRRLSTDVDIPSPGTGTVVEEMDLVPMQSIGQQSLGPEIAKIAVGWPWWFQFLAALLLLCLVFCCFYCVMKKNKPSHTPLHVDMEVPPSPASAARPAPLVPLERKADTLRLDFQDGAIVRTVNAKWRPLGIKHNFIAPIIAHDFTINSYAKQALGIKDGWKLKRIGYEELNDNPNFDQVNGKLHEYMKDFPIWPLPMEFAEDLEGGELQMFRFTERPIGIEFKNRAPITVDKVFEGSPAALAGVQPGWVVTKIGDFEITEETTFQDAMTALCEGVTPLDDMGRSYPTNAHRHSVTAC